MPQPGGGNSYMPYPPAAGGGGGAFPPYPPVNNFPSAIPPYPPVGGSPNQGATAGAGSYPYGMPYPPAGGAYNSSPGGGYPPSNATTQNQTGTITEQHIKASLISAVEDKLRRRIQEKVNQCQAEIQTLKRTKQELTEGRSKINEIIGKLEREETELRKNISVLEDKDQELEKSLESLEKVDGIDVDEAVTTTAPLYRQ